MSVPDWQVEGTMDRAQRDALLHALEVHDYNVARAVAQLRIGRSTMYRLMKRFEIDRVERPEVKKSERPARTLAPPRKLTGGSRRSRTEPVVRDEIVFDGQNYLLVRRGPAGANGRM